MKIVLAAAQSHLREESQESRRENAPGLDQGIAENHGLDQGTEESQGGLDPENAIGGDPGNLLLSVIAA